MKQIALAWGMLRVAVRHLASQAGLTLALAVGLTLAIALTVSVPMYADAIYYRVLVDRMSSSGRSLDQQTVAAEAASWSRPAFSFLFRYLGTLHGGRQWEQVQPVDAYLTGPGLSDLALPVTRVVRHFKTRSFNLYPPDQVDHTRVTKPITTAPFGTISDLEGHVTLVAGQFPRPAESDGPVEFMVGESYATQAGLKVGSEFIAYDRRVTSAGEVVAEVPVRLAGVWQATDPDEEFWFYHPSALTGQLLVPPVSFVARVAPVLADEIVLGLWYLVMDGSNTHAEDINPLFERIMTVQNRAAAYLPYTELDGATLAILEAYRRDAQVLTILLYAFSIPVIGLTLAFVLLVMGLSVERRRGEIAMLRSRGASIGQVVGIAVGEGLLIGAAALTAGLILGGVIVQTMGRTRSFLVMGLLEEAGVGDAWLRVGLTTTALAFGVAAVALAVLAGVAPALGAARHTMVTYKQERARLLRRPWWQRVGLDVALLVPVIYGAYVLRKQGAFVLPIGNAQAAGDPFLDPLLFFVPALAVWAITLLLLRCLPGLMRALGHLLGYTRSTGFLLAARQLSRMPGFYAAPLVLLVLTLSLSAYTASLAQTLDAHMYDEAFYRVGADLRLDPSGSKATGADAAPGAIESAEPWLSVPVSEYARAPGAVAAARVGRYPTVIRLAGGAQEGAYIGLDRLDFPNVAFWRRDFAAQRLGGLMNALASAPEAVLVPREFLEANALRIGDTVRVQVETEGQLTQLDLRIAGDFELFPTWYPDEGPLVVGNLDYLYESAGSEHPYAVWLNTGRGADPAQTVAGVRRRGMRMGSWDAPLIRVARAQVQPERQGLFGLLSAGFVASAMLTVIGFLIYAMFSFRRRAIEIGMLRAIGLSNGEMAAFLAWELGFLVVVGLVAGTVLGVWSSKLFIPYLQIGAEASARIPPYSVTVAWPAIFRIYALFAALFVAALAVLLILLSRMRLFQAIKLGEAA